MEKLNNLLSSYSFEIPVYQRAYSWGEKQVNDFWNDINECSDKNKQYYYGHFLFEYGEGERDKLMAIDGQQRLTTVYLFKLISTVFNNKIQIFEFKTVEYDNEVLTEIKNSIEELTRVFDELSKAKKAEYEIANSFLNKIHGNKLFSSLQDKYEKNEVTRSSKNIINALYFLYDQLKKVNDKDKIEKLNETVDNSVVTYIISDRNKTGMQLAIDIFELHNTRGIPITTIEKVKAKLMAFLIEYGGKDENINKIQKYFSDIFKIEEQTIESFFRGEMPLDKILLHHLRVIDDGYKKDDFDSPSRSGNREEKILEYIKKKVSEKPDKVKYIEDLTKEFYNSVFIMGRILPEWDNKNELVGDVLILDRELSVEFFLLLLKTLVDSHYQQIAPDKGELTLNDMLNDITLNDILKKWEKFVYIRDFHDKYYRLFYRDDFPKLFYELFVSLKENAKGINNEYGERISDMIEKKLDYYLEKGFRPDKFQEGENLIKVVYGFIDENKESILKNAYYWYPEKMKYLLYKYYKEGKLMDKKYLRRIFKEGVSLEHILPRNWRWEWIGAKPNNLTDEEHKFNQSISDVINGIGNLMLLTSSDNSSLKDKKPTEKLKHLQKCGIITDMNNDWWKDLESSKKWKESIERRGENIFNFLIKYFVT